MKDYDISENLLKDAINYPDSVTEGYGDRKIYQKKLDSYLLRVIVKANKGIIRVVTVLYIGPGVRDMKYEYDPETDILLIKLTDSLRSHTQPVSIIRSRLLMGFVESFTAWMKRCMAFLLTHSTLHSRDGRLFTTPYLRSLLLSTSRRV